MRTQHHDQRDQVPLAFVLAADGSVLAGWGDAVTAWLDRAAYWAALVPEATAINQAAWERRHAVARAVVAGATQKEIAEKMGLTAPRVHQLYNKAMSERMRRHRAPVQAFLEKVERP